MRGNVAGRPVQGVLRIVDETRLKSAASEAVEAFRLDDSSILSQPNVFKYMVAVV
jgi:hypothetical protein